MLLFAILWLNFVGAAFTEAFTGYDDSQDKWYGPGLRFSWPQALGQHLRAARLAAGAAPPEPADRSAEPGTTARTVADLPREAL